MTTKTLPTNPRELRGLIRSGKWTKTTVGLASGYVHANLAVLPKELAFDFLLFCQRNPEPCPLLEVVEAGDVEAKQLAPGSDLRTDLPRYRVFRSGEPVEEVADAAEHWREDLVSFLIGCSFTFQRAVEEAGIVLRHFDQGQSDATFVSNIPTKPAGVFHGPMVVSMWPIHWSHVSRVVQITSRFPAAHGAPVHIGDPSAIGIKDILKPEYGDAIELREGEVPVFWGCGVTPQEAILRSKPSLAITHSAGHMFITDVRDQEIAAL